MTEIHCPRCGYSDVALVKREFINNMFKKTYRCPRCSHIWEHKE